MAKALEYPVVFKALLDGGYICSINAPVGSLTKIVVHTAGESGSMGHITEKQLMELQKNSVVKLQEQLTSKDKYGNLYHYFELVK